MADPTQNRYVAALTRVNERARIALSLRLTGEDVQGALADPVVPAAAVMTPERLQERAERLAGQAQVHDSISERKNPLGKKLSVALPGFAAARAAFEETKKGFEEVHQVLTQLHHDVELGHHNVDALSTMLQGVANRLGQGEDQTAAMFVLGVSEELGSAGGSKGLFRKEKTADIAGPILLDAVKETERRMNNLDAGLDTFDRDADRLVDANRNANLAHHARVESQQSFDVGEHLRGVWTQVLDEEGLTDTLQSRDVASVDSLIEHVASTAVAQIQGPQLQNEKSAGRVHEL